MYGLNYDPERQPVAVPVTPAYEGLLEDLELGKIPSLQELRARLNVRSDGYVMIGERLLEREGRYVTEGRRVNDDQKKEILLEASVFDGLRQSNTNAESYISFYQEIARGEITSPKELRARLNPRSDGYVMIGERYLELDNRYVVEKRRVSKEQGDILLEAQRIVNEAGGTIASLSNTANFMVDICGNTILSSAELRGRLNPRSDGYVMIGERYLERGGKYVIEPRRVDQVRRTYLLAKYQEQDKMQSFTRNAQDAVSFISDITNDAFSSATELRARLNPRSDGYVMIGERYLERGGKYVIEPRRVDTESVSEIQTFFADFAKLDDGMKSIIRGMQGGLLDIGTANRAMAARRQNSITQSDLQANEVTASIVQALSRQISQARLSRAVAANIQRSPDDIRLNFELFRDFGLNNEADRAFIQKLNRVTYDARRQNFAQQLLTDLSGTTSTSEYGALGKRLNEFADSPFPEDRQEAERLRQFVYEKELAQQTVVLVSLLNPGSFQEKKYADYIGSLPLRASTTTFAYDERLKALLATVAPLAQEVKNALLSQEVAKVIGGFRNKRTREVLELINVLDAPEDSTIRESVLAFYKQYLLSRQSRRPTDYREAFSFEIEALRAVIAPEYEFDQKIGKNIDALKILVSRFKTAITPLYQSLRSESMGQSLASYSTVQNNTDPRRKYTLRVSELRKQRPLTPIEQSYLTSVEVLSLFNPHLIALANEAPDITSVYLESHFNALSEATFEALNDTTTYFPLVQIGQGPSGMASAGEVLRRRSDLADQSLYIDSAALPGGPFAIPKGPAWSLNSANSNEVELPILPPPTPEELQGKTVRAYGSPMRWYPGERLSGSDVRQGSINSSVDYLLAADSISTSRYPDNADEALVLQEQAAVLLKNCLLNTDVLAVEPQPEPGYPDRMRLTIQHRLPNGSRINRFIMTDWLIGSSGLGEPTYGFDLETSRAKRVLALSQQWGGFPKLSETLTAFNALASEESDRPQPGEVMVIAGNGNSADTLLEYLGGLFSGNNKGIRNIKKIYIITTGSLSQRPRYAATLDLRPRNGRGNLVEIINARIGDLDFVGSNPSKSSRLRIFDSDGNEIKDQSGQTIRADNVIAATGFRPNLNKILAPILKADIRASESLEKVTLPTNKNVAVADRVRNNKHILLVGTGSRTGFEILDKLAQLPDESREALLRNGAENAVAIGFRAPDTQAAVRLFLDEVPESILPATLKKRVQRTTTSPSVVSPGTISQFQRLAAARVEVPTRRNVVADSSILTPLFLRSLADVATGNEQQTYRFQVTFSNDTTAITNLTAVSAGLLQAVAEACNDPYFYAYARQALARRRDTEAIEIKLTTKNGKIVARSSFTQPR